MFESINTEGGEASAEWQADRIAAIYPVKSKESRILRARLVDLPGVIRRFDRRRQSLDL